MPAVFRCRHYVDARARDMLVHGYEIYASTRGDGRAIIGVCFIFVDQGYRQVMPEEREELLYYCWRLSASDMPYAEESCCCLLYRFSHARQTLFVELSTALQDEI